MKKNNFTEKQGVRYVELQSEDPRERGLFLGEVIKDDIREGGKLIRKIFGHKHLGKFALKFFLRIINRPYQRYFSDEVMAEAEGIAQAAGISVHSIIFYNLLWEFSDKYRLFCSTLATNLSKGGLVGHNTDLHEKVAAKALKFKPLVIKTKSKDNYTVWQLGLPAFLGVINGINDQGLIVCSQAIPWAKHQKKKKGMPFALLIRMILEKADTLDKAELLIKQHLSHSPFSLFIVSAKDKKAALFEINVTEYAKIKSEDYLCATNHYLTETLKNKQKKISKGSVLRKQRLEELIKIQGKELTHTQLQAILADTKHGIERKETGRAIANTGTLQSMIFDNQQQKMYLAKAAHAPVSNNCSWIEFNLKENG